MNKIYLTTILLFAGCVSSPQVSNEPITSEQYDPDQVEQRAQELGLRPVDYLHRVNNESLIFYQAFDAKWSDPSINPVFDTKVEAEKYAKENNMGNNHSYVVREVNYRYVVRVGFSDYTYSNGSWNDILHTSLKFNDAYEYVVEYSSSHSDLIIYDLKTGKTFEETP
jgi:hypothetical protein